MEAEKDISAILDDVAQSYSHDDIALTRRQDAPHHEAWRTTTGRRGPGAYSDGFNVKPGEESTKSPSEKLG